MHYRTFDEQFYLAHNPDVVAAIQSGQFISALEHYLAYGANELRDPNPYLDAEYYARHNPDVMQAIALGAFSNVLEHYEAFGSVEHRNPNAFFDAAYYADHNPDVVGAVTTGAFGSLYEHYVRYGAYEGREYSAGHVFVESMYLLNNRDVEDAVQKGLFRSGFEHFALYGVHENRQGVIEEDSTENPDDSGNGGNGGNGSGGGGGGGGSTGATYNLTSAVDNIPGTNGNDNIRAVLGGATPTLNPLDQIHGGGGTDTLSITLAGNSNNDSLPIIDGIENMLINTGSGFSLQHMDLTATAVENLLINGSGRLGTLSNLNQNTSLVLQGLATSGGADTLILLKEQSAGINFSLTLKNMDTPRVYVGVDEHKDGSATNDTLSLVLDNIKAGEFVTSDIENFNVKVNSNSSLDSVSDAINANQTPMRNSTVNLLLNADLSVGFWDISDSDLNNTSRFIVKGSGALTIHAFDDGSSTIDFDSTTATGDMNLGLGNQSLYFIKTGQGNDTITGGMNADHIETGAGSDVLIGGGGPDDLTGGDGADLFVQGISDGMNITDAKISQAFNFINGDQLFFADGVDVVYDFTVDVDHLHVDQAINRPVLTTNFSVEAVNYGIANNQFVIERGNYASSTKIFTKSSTGGSDLMIAYDADGSVNIDVQFVILSGISAANATGEGFFA